MSKPTFQILSDTNLYSNALTPFKAIATSSSDFSTNYYIWDFGDGNTKTGQEVEYVFETVGEFGVTLTQFLSSGQSVESDAQTVVVTNLIPNLMDWDDNSFSDDSITASVKNSTPYIVNTFNSWQQYDENPFLDLYVENSKSIPFDITDKRIHLKPNWRFLDANDNVVETIPLNQTKIYGFILNDEIYLTPENVQDSVFVGVSSQTEFFFIDDTPSGIDASGSNFLPTTLIITQDLSGIYGDKKFENRDYIHYPSLIKSIFIDNIIPSSLYISSNGAFDIDYTKYINTQIPFNIRLVDDGGNFIKTNPQELSSVNDYTIEIGFVDPVSILDNGVFLNKSLNRFVFDFSNLGGFYEGSFIPTQSISETTELSAYTKIDYTLNKTVTRYGSFTDENSNKIYRVSFIEGFENAYKRKDADQIDPIIISDNNYSNVFGIAVDGFYNTVFLDSDVSRVELYDKNFNFTNHYELSSYDEYLLTSNGQNRNHSSPAQICLNVESDYFITLHDSSDLIYIKNGNVQEINLYDVNTYFDRTPASIELLSDNETLFISFTSTKSNNFVEKFNVSYNSNDTISLSSLQTLNFGNTVIHDMVSNRNGDFIYMLSVDYNDGSSSINVYDVTQNLSSDIFIGYDAEFITIDNDQNVWSASKNGGDLFLNKIENTSLSSFSLSSFGGNTISNIGGISGDSHGNVWLLDYINKRIIIFKSSDINDFKIVNILEDQGETDIKYVAYGDWNGFRWYNKFGYGEQIITYELSGQSSPFIIHPRDKYNLQKINEDFDMTEVLKSYRTTEPMLNFDNLFDNFLGSIYGNKFDNGTFIGKNFFEKIANFVMNHGDIDTCSIDALESFCNETGIEFTNKIDFPRDIKRLVELFSIRFKKLWGDNFKDIVIDNYIGDYIDTNSYIISADPQINFIAKEKFNNNLSIVTPFILDDLGPLSSNYPLSSYQSSWGWGLSVPEDQPIEKYYDFYELKEIDFERIIDVVDWENELTNENIQPLSSYDNYMNSDGIVSTILGEKIRIGLDLFYK